MPIVSTKDIFFGFVKGFLAIWQLWLFLGVLALIKFAYMLWDKNRLAKSGINEIDQMDGLTFEKYLEALFEKLGYRVERTQYVGDYGADLVTTKEGIKTVIQAKRYKNKVGIKAVQEAVAAKGKYGCSEAMVITNSFYSKAAIELAKANRVELWNRNHLVKALLSIKKDSSNTEVQQEAATTDIQQVAKGNDICAGCNKPVSEKEKQYCLSNKQRFSGNIYCYDHQHNR
jgi:Predicted endonuclease distantly related to archaeal Holliday junction resolvase and Mrr-like restriction enzymes